MTVEHRITIAAAPDLVFAIYRDVANWHTWDPDTKRAVLDGPFAVGSRGRLTPARGNTVPLVLTPVDPERGFTVEARIPFFRMVFEHELTRRTAGETGVVHRVTFSGLLARVLGPMLTRRLNDGLPVTLARLKALAEARSAR